MKAMAMVAHPDDCVIFAYSFMHHYKQLDWTVCYLTYTEQDARGREFANFWQQRGVSTKFLGYVDDYRDIEAKRISFDTAAAAKDIQQAIKDQREGTEDPKLEEILNEIETRAAVELAKLEYANTVNKPRA